MFNLRAQIFITFLSFILLLTGGLFLYSRLSFERGFAQYIEQKEAARNAKLINALESYYQLRGSWYNFASNNRYWLYFVQIYMPQKRSRNPSPIPFPQRRDMNDPFDENADEDNYGPAPESFLQMPPSMPRLSSEQAQALQNTLRQKHQEANDYLRHEPFKRFILLDAQQRLIAGKKWANENYILSELTSHFGGAKQLVGYLGTPMNPALRDLRDTEFAKQQQQHFLLMTITAIGIALLCAIPLSHLLTTRVKKLATHVQRLSSGDYGERISSRGKDEISTLAEHLNHLAHTLEQSEKTRKRWVADISHELRTPLAVLQADLEALEDGVRQFDAKALGRLQKHASRLTRLVNDLYQLALTDIGDMSYRKQACNIEELLDDLCHSMETKAAQTGLTLSFNKPAESLMVMADAQRIQQLLLNLLNNSINYTHAPGRIALSLMRDGNNALLSIDDTAPGVDSELHEKLFERLYRAESSRSRETGGAGLGLSICQNIVLAHNGTIKIDHSELGGLKISIRLPLLQS